MIHLHLHSTYSVLDGLGKVKDIVARAKELDAPAVAITDHASISCLTDLFKEAKDANIKPIIGVEFYWVEDSQVEGEKGEDRKHFTAWAKSWRGVKSLMKALSVANRQFYRRPRLTWSQCLQLEDCVVGTACAHGVLACDDYRQKVDDLVRAYGSENVFLEIMPFAGAEQEIVNLRAIELKTIAGCQLLATSDAHYVRREDMMTHEVLLAVQTGATWDDPNRWKFDVAAHMRDINEHVFEYRALGYLADNHINEALVNTAKVVKMVDVRMPKFTPHLPTPYVGDDAEQNEKFMSLIFSGWKRLKDAFDPRFSLEEYGKRLAYEVEVISRLGFVKYFLVVEDIIRYARSVGIMVGPARGSSAGSLVCFLLGITQVDPLRHELYFERFLNPERIDLPDIDVDFQDDRRDEVFAYIKAKYGHEYVGHINTYGVLTEKSAFRDVCRVFGIGMMQINMLSKLIEDAESFDKVPELMAFGRKHPEIVKQAKKLAGVIRQNGVHACGLVVASEPLSEVAVIERRKDVEVVNWDKVQAEGFGLLKIDVLGLTTLTILQMAQELIAKRHGVTVDFPVLPLDDQKTLEAFERGDCLGVFQFEGAQMSSLLRSIKARDFETITAATALYRPGSLNSGQTEMYVKITKGDEYERYACEQLKGILGNTKGVLVYQEQIMRIFNELGGFTWAQADKMRKIIGKKLGKDEFEKHRAAFVEGCVNNDIDASVASVLFDKMVEFAEYAFNKSHAVAYTIISYWTMWVKVHYPVEFYAAQMSHLSDISKLPLYVAEAARYGVEVLPPDINSSAKRYRIDDDNNIVAPLGIIKGVGGKAVDEILAAREAGIFVSAEDLMARVQRRIVNVRVIDTLKRAGAMRSVGIEDADAEQRAKDYSELLPLYAPAPSLSVGERIDADKLNELLHEVALCSDEHKHPVMPPKALGSTATIMVINNPVKNEREHLTNDGTKLLLTSLKGVGVDQKLVYYTSPCKCFHKAPNAIPKDCLVRCGEYLRREILTVRPKLIVCCSPFAMKLFGVEEQMSKYNGTVVFSKEFDAYVLFSVSPQAAYYAEDKMAPFLENMEKIKSFFE